MITYNFGIVGLGVMGRNLLLNMADNGYAVAGLDLDREKADSLQAEAQEGHQIYATVQAEDFVKSLEQPRAIMLLVPAGAPVDGAIQTLLPFLDQGDIIIDGGNTYFTDTDRRYKELSSKGIHFFGMGISGGESGARRGPSMMPGGDKIAYERLRPIFEAIAAKVDGEPCVEFLGNGSAGNYVKMVHNGIEYGIMQLIAETYDIMKNVYHLDHETIQQSFEQWNKEELNSFLIEITADILKKKEDDKYLVDLISDWAKSKGTGKWTSQNAMDLQVPVPVIDAAVNMRDISKYKPERIKASKLLIWNNDQKINNDGLDQLKKGLYFAIITTYAQGLAQLKVASDAYGYDLHLETVCKIWRGGCIIRATLLEDFRQAFAAQSDLPNVLLNQQIADKLNAAQGSIRSVLKDAIQNGTPVSAWMNALSYFDAYRSENLPTNIIQAQRDFFGAHTYERIDKEGVFHTRWEA
ncbi:MULTISPECIES: NADP-dependent phosphogluconate dehydrogenase [unclassified Chryseobacterium]|uniref:NADP-dependent phosphogluconate dehydrogenase n=1 Tax=unclassified Chryseobacterium TaxID=2593645 RepID=UPI00100A64D2|nr:MULTISPECIES: NADP-dependent phosphogluconate dehydrogenase [unclassified Chryseobacterium]RXM50555.1 phosphogluconate dehydrogenase (NADP(+)-dependent, decarboxylating) [Chryseobacterium sp. CH25]RXM63191.1 phosphogluconate dehydrogenase (NADP(+)-dependent, decarboxylating) [Chryseobacterium sp. CH1]